MPPMKLPKRPSLLLLALLLLALGTLQTGCGKDKGPEQSPYQVFH